MPDFIQHPIDRVPDSGNLPPADNAPDLRNIRLDDWEDDAFRSSGVQVQVLRLDKIHQEISGNKWFKLKYFLKEAKRTNKHTLISFGGAYSNHLLALSAAAALNGMVSIGIIRGEEPAELSHTLLASKRFGMKLQFLSRADFLQKKNIRSDNNQEPPDSRTLWIPEGGSGLTGVRGAEEILSTLPVDSYSHICCAAGTGTSLAGIINSSNPQQHIIGVSVLKGTTGLNPLKISYIKNPAGLKNVTMIHDDHFGGYAKRNQLLFNSMNRVFANSGIPTDFVYTGKLFYSVLRLATAGHFPRGSRILVLHTGGLQGNRSLPSGSLDF